MSDFPLAHHLAERIIKRKVVKHFSREPPSGTVIAKNPIELAPGTPNYGLFPVDSIVLNLLEKPFQQNIHTKPAFNDAVAKYQGSDKSKTETDIYPKESATGFKNTNVGETAVQAVITKETSSVANSINIKDSFQYSNLEGFPQLLKFTKDLITKLHSPPLDDSQWGTILTNGGGDGLNKLFSLLVNPGDTILAEEFTFVPTIWSIEDFGGYVHPVELDLEKDGIDPVKLDQLLETWETTFPSKKKPHVLYTIASGQNPTGLSQSYETRAKLYKVAQKHDLIIVEDDPYGYIILPPFDHATNKNSVSFDNLSVEEYAAKHINKSLLHFDTDGRVLRAESFSKLISPGIRLGFVAGHKFFLDKVSKLTKLSTKFPSGAAQAIVYSVIQYWGGVDGYLNWGIEVSKVYQHRRDVFYRALKETESFKKGWISFIEATAGMFISLRVNFPGAIEEEKDGKRIFKSTNGKTYAQLLDELNDVTAEVGVHVVIAGSTLAIGDDASATKGNILRTTFVAASNDDTELIEGVNRLDKSILKVFNDNGF